MDSIGFRLRVFVIILLAVMGVGTFGFMSIEGLSLIDAVYFSIVTVATVGYGDIHPVTSAGKFLAVVLIITGVGTFLGVVANATEMLLNRREKKLRDQKLHMITGLFFSEIGTRLLTFFSRFDVNTDVLRESLIITDEWVEKDFTEVDKRLKSHRYNIDVRRGEAEELRRFLNEKGWLLLRMLENPILLERESFTELLRAIFHLREELLNRPDLSLLPDTDRAHLAGDIRRAYALLVHHWLDYMKYLKNHYPYLFSLAMRINPFNQDASPIVK